jgi:hypothetical protein
VTFPAFFSAVPAITLRDPLAAVLGAARDGLLSYGYADAVRLAGHSCPTVAGAWLMLRHGLRRLYGEEIPERGAVEVWLRGRRDEGTTGVVAAVAGLVTGAAPETGFGGIGPGRRFMRRDLLRFGAPIDGVLALRRRDDERDDERDGGRGVVLGLDTGAVPAAPELAPLLALVAAGRADGAQQARFAELWQDRVRRMLTLHADDPALITLAAWTPAA